MKLSDAIDLYNADRRAKGIKRSTREAEARTLRLLLADIGNIELNHLRPQHIDRFWANRDGWGPGTTNLALGHLKRFVEWAQERGWIRRDRNPLHGIRRLRVKPRHRIIIPQQEFETFLEGIWDPRIRAACAIGLYMFTRVSETSALRWQDVDLHNGVAEVYRRKTEQLDALPICTELIEELKRWRLDYAAKIGRQLLPGDFVIPGYQQGKARGIPGQRGGFTYDGPDVYLPQRQANLTAGMRRALTEAGYYQPHEGGHTLRRSGAIALYNQLTSVGHDRAIRICQAMLGHSNIRTTETYLMLDLDRKVRNDLLAGKPMFPEQAEALVLELGEHKA